MVTGLTFFEVSPEEAEREAKAYRGTAEPGNFVYGPSTIAMRMPCPN